MTDRHMAAAAHCRDERIVLWMLLVVIFGEGFPVIWTALADFEGLQGALGMRSGALGGAWAWALAGAIAVEYVRGAMRIPSVRAWVFRPAALKALALVAALMAGILEEVVFRRWLMDALQHRGAGAVLQIVASGAAFGVAHVVWGLVRREARAALHAVVATSLLGAGLGLVYVLAGRSLAPCVAAHVAITALIEPGLLLAACRGELGWPRRVERHAVASDTGANA